MLRNIVLQTRAMSHVRSTSNKLIVVANLFELEICTYTTCISIRITPVGMYTYLCLFERKVSMRSFFSKVRVTISADVFM